MRLVVGLNVASCCAAAGCRTFAGSETTPALRWPPCSRCALSALHLATLQSCCYVSSCCVVAACCVRLAPAVLQQRSAADALVNLSINPLFMNDGLWRNPRMDWILSDCPLGRPADGVQSVDEQRQALEQAREQLKQQQALLASTESAPALQGAPVPSSGGLSPDAAAWFLAAREKITIRRSVANGAG
jgi:hypothetical protein